MRTLRAVVRVNDHAGAMPRVGQRILAALLLNEPEDLVAWTQGASKPEIAALAREVRPHNANLISGCRVIQDGIRPYGGFGTSLCGELFSTPWHEKNVVVTFGDMGGRMFNRLKQDELFVIIPLEYVDNLPTLLVDVQIDTKANLGFTKPPWSKFWEKLWPGWQSGKTEG